MLVITGASGHLGRAVAAHAATLRGSGDGLVLTTRDPAALDGAVPGAEVRYADFEKPESLIDAFAGATRVLVISTDDIGGRAAGQMAAVDAAAAAGAQQVLYTSMLAPEPGNPAIVAPSHWATEQHIRANDIDHTIIRAGFYADFQVFEAAEALSTGEFAHNRGTGRCAYLTRDDIARTAAALLVGGGHAGQTLELTGTVAHDPADLAALYSAVGGRDVAAVEIDDDEMLTRLGGNAEGHNQYGAQLLVSIGQATRAGLYDIVTDTVRSITGEAPESLESVLERSAEMLRSAGD